MGKAINLIKKEVIHQTEVTLTISVEENYKVEISNTSYPELRHCWEFGSTALDEVQAFYWYRKVIKMVENYDQYPHEIAPILYGTKTKQIREMCKTAVASVFGVTSAKFLIIVPIFTNISI